MIAEVSALNAIVFCELGLAHALGKDSFIWIGQTSPGPELAGQTCVGPYCKE